MILPAGYGACEDKQSSVVALRTGSIVNCSVKIAASIFNSSPGTAIQQLVEWYCICIHKCLPAAELDPEIVSKRSGVPPNEWSSNKVSSLTLECDKGIAKPIEYASLKYTDIVKSVEYAFERPRTYSPLVSMKGNIAAEY